MELMDMSLHDLYKLVYENLHLTIPEWVVGKMAEAVSLFLRPSLSGFSVHCDVCLSVQLY